MKIRPRVVLKFAGSAAGLLLAAGLIAPYITADQFGKRLQASLERSLGRRVEIGRVRFSLFEGPGFSVDDMTIHEDPAFGNEPIAYVQESGGVVVEPSLWYLLGGRFVISAIRLDGASINLTKSGPASEPGRWNFASFLNRSVLRSTPAIHIRNSRINFKFGDTKSVFYLTDTDLDIGPSGGLTPTRWNLSCSAKPARTDRSAAGLGLFTLQGRWYTAPERVDMDLTLDHTALAEITALIRGEAGTVHGTVSSRLHLGGPIQNIGIQGRLNIDDVHRWDLLPPYGRAWPIDVRGRLDLVGQQIELQSTSADNTTPPLSARFRVTDYLTQPHWAVAVDWNRFPIPPLMDLATHMGAQFPPRLALSGSMDGAIGYSNDTGLEGELAFHDAALTIPDSPPVRFEQAQLLFDHGHVRLTPTLVRTAGGDEAQIQADCALKPQSLDLSISTQAMQVASLRAQVALASVPFLEQLGEGRWSGQLHYRVGQPGPGGTPAANGWAGSLHLTAGELTVPGLADPLELASARVQIAGAHVVLDRIDAHAGKLAFAGDYRYEPGVRYPHRFRLRIKEADAAALETEFLPTLRRRSSLLARALGRIPVPDWLKQRGVEGILQFDDLALAGAHLANVRARLVWDATHVELDNLQAKLGRSAVAGKLTVNLRGRQPAYRLTGNVKGLDWQSGKVDADGAIETFGTGAQVLANLTCQGTFTASVLDFGTPEPWYSVSGSYSAAWSPRLRLTALQIKTEDETYTGRGAAQDDGTLVILLNSGAKELRMTGTLAKLKIAEIP